MREFVVVLSQIACRGLGPPRGVASDPKTVTSSSNGN